VTPRPVRASDGRRPATPAEPDLVADLVQALDDAVARLEPDAHQPDARAVLRLLRASRELLQATGGAIETAGRHPDLPRWRHDLRMYVAAMAGWSVILGQRQEEATRLRATETIERNAKALSGLLAQPPAA
jgi:hypothetical protein